MKNLLLLLLLLGAFTSKAQWGTCLDTSAIIYELDSNDFDNFHTTHFKLDVDTADTTNIWMIGAVSKTGFPAALSGTNAIQTDTLLPYTTDLNSMFYIWRDTITTHQFDNNAPFSISFWHYYDVDSLLDSCMVQMTTDSGETWTGTAYLDMGFWATYEGSLYSTQQNPNTYNRILFTGKSSGWVQERICFISSTIWNKSTAAFNHYFGYRFLFKSDGIYSGKPGWIIDDIQLTTPLNYELSVADIQSNPLSVFPNPSATGLYTLSYPSTYVTGTLAVYDVFGRKVQEAALSKTIDLSALPAGTYLYRAQFRNYDKVYTGRLIRQ